MAQIRLLSSVWRRRRKSLRLIGYWRIHADLPDAPGSFRLGDWSEEEIAAANAAHRAELAHWPDARNFVDPAWRPEIRHKVVVYLARGRMLVRYRGLSQCRFCARNNGSAEFTDGKYVWPEGLAHYVVEHDVRLPAEFVERALASPRGGEELTLPEFDDLGQRVRDANLDAEDPSYGPDMRIDHTWWLKRQHL